MFWRLVAFALAATPAFLVLFLKATQNLNRSDRWALAWVVYLGAMAAFGAVNLFGVFG